MNKELRRIFNNCKQNSCMYFLSKGNIYYFCDCDSNNRAPHFFDSSRCIGNYLKFKVNVCEHSHVVIIDKCVLNDIEFPNWKKFDFMFVNNKNKVICIVEMKSSKLRKLKERRRKAYEQLEGGLAKLIRIFPNRNYTIYAIACVSNRKIIPTALSSSINRRVKFKKRFKGFKVELCDGCEIENFPHLPCRRNR